jgi:hypothetical protein
MILNWQQYSLIFYGLYLVATATNDTELYFNETTTIEVNSTLISFINVGNQSDLVDTTVVLTTVDTVTIDNDNVDNRTAFNVTDNLSTWLPILNSTGSLLSTFDEITDRVFVESTFMSSTDDTSMVTTDTQMHSSLTNDTNEPSTTNTMNTSCELSVYGCCSDGRTKRNGK